MPDIKFSCPHCGQHISAEPNYAGMEIGCPACKGSLVVPGQPPAQSAAPPPPPPPSLSLRASAAPAPAQAESTACPSCGTELAKGAVLCTSCGFNLRTGKRMAPTKPGAPAGRRPAAAARQSAADPWEVPWYKTAYPYVGLVVGVLALLYFLGRSNPALMLAFLAVIVLYVFTVHIIVAVAAFRTSGVGIGLLTLCLGPFTIYYVFKLNENDTLKILYGLSLLLILALKFISLGAE